MGYSVFTIFAVIIIVLAELCVLADSRNILLSANQNNLSPDTPVTNVNQASTTVPNDKLATTAPGGLSQWMYIAIIIGVILLLFIQTLCFCYYMRKAKSRRSYNNLTMSTLVPEESEARYNTDPTKQNAPKSAAISRACSIYACVDDSKVGEGKPLPPPLSTMPRRTNWNRLPLPSEMKREAPKAATLTPESTQELLLNRSGREVSTVPVRPVMNFHMQARGLTRAPSSVRRVPSPEMTVNTHMSQESLMYNKFTKIYDSLPDVRALIKHPKPQISAQLPLIMTPPKPLTPIGNKPRLIPGDQTSPIMHKYRMPLSPPSNESIRNARQTPSPIMHNHRMLPNENARKAYPPKPKETMMNVDSKINGSLTDLRPFQNHPKPKPPITPKVNKPRQVPENDELMRKLKKRAEMNETNTRLALNQSHGQPRNISPQPVIPKPSYDDSSDEEWKMEDLKPMNLYNV